MDLEAWQIFTGIMSKNARNRISPMQTIPSSTKFLLHISTFLCFSPKKDQCDDCVMFNNSDEEAKAKLKERYDMHQSEKQISRQEKLRDKTEENVIVAVYDLQAVMQLPQGDVSTLYYKFKLNLFNFKIYIKKNLCDCFV